MLYMKTEMIILGLMLSLVFTMSFISASITSVSCPESFNLISGSTVDKQFTIIGTGGSVVHSINCDKGSQELQPSPPLSLSEGKLIITGRFGLTTAKDVETATCTFSANDINNPNNEKSCVFAYSSTKDTGNVINNQQTTNNKSAESQDNTLLIIAGIVIIVLIVIIVIILKKKR